MPSLRRSFSSPSVRSSPYPSSLSTASSPAARTRPAAPHPRRSSGSAAAERRVLADIEWWRVYDGQCDLDSPDQAQEQAPVLGDGPPGAVVTLSLGGGSTEPPQTPLSLHSFSMDSPFHPNPFAALSVAPYSPQGSSNHSRQSSVESTPELSAASLEAAQLGLANPVSCPFGHQLLFPLPLTRVGGRQTHPLFGLRSFSAPDPSRQGTLEPDFADMGGDTFSLDQNLFQ